MELKQNKKIAPKCSLSLLITHTVAELHSFDSVSDEELVAIIKEMSQKYCDLDPSPTKILLKCLPLLSYIVEMNY